MYDVEEIRHDFPILEREVNGKRLVYLDNAATSQKPRRVLDALTDFYERRNANIHRGVHSLAEEATAAYEEGAAEGIPFYRRAGRESPDLHPRHDRVHKPRRPRLGPQVLARRRRGGPHRGRAPLEPRPLAARRAGDRRDAALYTYPG